MISGRRDVSSRLPTRGVSGEIWPCRRLLEHPSSPSSSVCATDYYIPYFEFRGTPTGIDIFKVVETGVTPVIDGGLGGRDGGQIGAGVLRAEKTVI